LIARSRNTPKPTALGIPNRSPLLPTCLEEGRLFLRAESSELRQRYRAVGVGHQCGTAFPASRSGR
jgi:hypothetical protein